MTPFRIALANLAIPRDPDDAVLAAAAAIDAAAGRGARVLCFPEAFVPGYPWPGRTPTSVDGHYLANAHAAVASAARAHGIAVVLGTERMVDGGRRLSALVVGADGEIAGYQDKVQLDPPEEGRYEPGTTREVFDVGGVRFGIAICHEGFRYPETVRWAARRGAQLVFHPHYSEAEPDGFRPTHYGDARTSFHERSVQCRAAENTVFVASVNCASDGSPTTSAVVRPDGSLLCHQPYGQAGLLLADLDLEEATRLFALRYRGTPTG